MRRRSRILGAGVFIVSACLGWGCEEPPVPGPITFPWTADTNLSIADTKIAGGFAYRMAGAGGQRLEVADLDGEGSPEIVIGCPGMVDYGTGSVWIVDGNLAPGTSYLQDIARTNYVGDLSGDQLGTVSVTPYPDAALAVGAFGHAGTEESAGAAYLFREFPSGELALSTADATFLGHRTDDGLGFSVALPSNGRGPLAIGAAGGDGLEGITTDLNYGGAYLVPEPSSIGGVWAAAETDGPLSAEQVNGIVGFHVAYVGDINGDGESDLAVAAPGVHGMADYAGVVYLFHGPMETLPSDLEDADATLLGLTLGDGTGGELFPAGDVDRDGRDDFFVSLVGREEGSNSAGAVCLVFGGLVEGEQSLAQVGLLFEGLPLDSLWMAAAGDLDGDDRTDLAFGGAQIQEGPGIVYVFLGSGLIDGQVPPGTISVADADAKLRGEADGDRAGISLRTADLDLDGLDDLLVGASRHFDQAVDEGAIYIIYGREP